MLLDGEFCNVSEFRIHKILIRNLKEKTFWETKLRRYRIKMGHTFWCCLWVLLVAWRA